MRTALRTPLKRSGLAVGVDYREDVYKGSGISDYNPKSPAAKTKAAEGTLRDYRSVWNCLPTSARSEELRKELSKWERIFEPTSLSPTLRHVQQSRSRWATEISSLAGHKTATTFYP